MNAIELLTDPTLAGWPAWDIYIPNLHIDTLKQKARNFQ